MPRLLDMCQVYDAQKDTIVTCVIVRKGKDFFDCKPISRDHYDPNMIFSESSAFHMAWWRIANDDPSYDVLDEKFNFDTVADLPRARVQLMWEQSQEASTALPSPWLPYPEWATEAEVK